MDVIDVLEGNLPNLKREDWGQIVWVKWKN